MTSRLQVFHLPDFKGGLVTKHPASELEINQSPDLDNIILLDKGFKQREGDVTFNSTAMNSGANVQGIAYYKEKGGNEFLAAIAGNKMFKSDDLDGTMDEISGAGGSSTAPSAGQDNIYTPVILKNLLIWFGPSAPQSWDGSTASNDYQDLSGTPPTADFAFSMRDRIFAGSTTANPSTLYWCILADPEDWTGTGSGNTTVVTNDGDELIGGIPLNNDVALLFKQYSIHFLVVNQYPFPVKPFYIGRGCCGKNAMVNVNGTVYFITKEPRMKATNGYDIIDFPDHIDDLWDLIPKNRLATIYGIYYPILEQIKWYVTGESGTKNNYCLIWDLRYKCWLRETTGVDVNVATMAQGYRLFAGQYDGKIYEKDVDDTYSDDSTTAPGTIDAYWYSGWLDSGNNIDIIHPRYMDIVAKTQTDAGNLVKFSYGFNYIANLKSGQFDAVSEGGKWDVDEWDVNFRWGGEAARQERIFIYGRGNNFQLRLFNDVFDQKFQVESVDIAMSIMGKKEITNV